MPKERRVNSSSFDRAMVSPYSCSSRNADGNNCDSSSPHAGDEREWEEARCCICMEHPHNAVLLLCSSREKGCRPFICDTSYRHSNCLDQFRKSAAASSLRIPPVELVCPLCRGVITGWDVIQPGRRFMNSKTRSCSLETCSFSGSYAELRKHARLKHPSERPSEASPTRQSNWVMLEQQREIEDVFAIQSDLEYDLDGWPSLEEWGEDDLWSDGSFFDFPSGMSDVEEELIDEMFSSMSFSFFSLYSTSPEEEEEMMDSGSSESNDRLQRTAVSTNSASWSNNQGLNILPVPVPVPMPIPVFHSENGPSISSLRSGYQRDSYAIDLTSRSSSHWENSSTISSPRLSFRQENASSSSRTRSSRPRENGSTISRSRSSHRTGNAQAGSRTRSSDGREYVRPSSMARSWDYPPPARGSASRYLPGSSRRQNSNSGRRGE